MRTGIDQGNVDFCARAVGVLGVLIRGLGFMVSLVVSIRWDYAFVLGWLGFWMSRRSSAQRTDRYRHGRGGTATWFVPRGNYCFGLAPCAPGNKQSAR